MKRFNLVTGWFLLLLVFASSINCFATPSIGKIQQDIKKARSLWTTDAYAAQKILEKAYNDSMAWTAPEFLDSVKQKALYVAVQCVSPALIPEVYTTADTYEKLYPKGIYLSKVLLYKAIAAFSVKDYDLAEAALKRVEEIAGGKVPYKTKSLRLGAYLSSAKYRTAEKYLEQSYLNKPDSRLKKDLRRFHRGNAYVQKLMEMVVENKISAADAVDKINRALENNYFAKNAPTISLIGQRIKDSSGDVYHPLQVEWCGLERAIHHTTSSQYRIHKNLEFIKKFPEATPEQKYLVLQNLRNIYLYETMDKELAEEILKEMGRMPNFGDRARVEEILCGFNEEKIITEAGRNELLELHKLKALFPYDNGALPVVTYDRVNLMLALSDMVVGDGKKSIVKSVPEVKGYSGLPFDLFFFGAVGQKLQAHEIFESVKAGQTVQVKRMIDDSLYPLYLPAGIGTRYFLAGLACEKVFPYLAMDLINKSITVEKRLTKNEHALAVLADTYQVHNAYKEAQEVWGILRSLHPQSIWLK